MFDELRGGLNPVTGALEFVSQVCSTLGGAVLRAVALEATTGAFDCRQQRVDAALLGACRLRRCAQWQRQQNRAQEVLHGRRYSCTPAAPPRSKMFAPRAAKSPLVTTPTI